VKYEQLTDTMELTLQTADNTTHNKNIIYEAVLRELLSPYTALLLTLYQHEKLAGLNCGSGFYGNITYLQSMHQSCANKAFIYLPHDGYHQRENTI
jgi:hypothetical protein